MAQPWVEGSKHSTLYGAKNCQVINENIFIKLTKSEDDIYFANYKIKYTIYSEVNQTNPLLFIGIGLSNKKTVRVNNNESKINGYGKSDALNIYYSKNDSLSVNKDDLIYFEAKLNKGKNTVYVEYDADLEYNTRGFIRTYRLEYSLYPSKFWKSFGIINIEMLLGDNLEVASSNIGQPEIKNDTAHWVIKNIKKDTIELEITKKTTILSDLLLILQPFGISILFLVVMFVYHRKLLIEKHKQKNLKYKSILSLGVLIIPILYYVIYFISYSLIDFTLGQANSKHGYVFLFVFTLPILMLVYGILMWIIDRKLKSKYSK